MRTFLPLLACFVCLAPLAIAGEAISADSASLFQRLDANGDGQLVANEIPENKRSFYERLLRLVDGDADGKLSADEFAAGLVGGGQQLKSPNKPGAAKQPDKARPGRPGKAGRPEPGRSAEPGRLFASLDLNGDGRVGLDEVPENRRPRFAKLIAKADQDGDKALSRAEFRKAMPVQMASTAGAKPSGSRFFARLDINGDGQLKAEEAPEERRKAIARLVKAGDKDGDGALSADEFSAIAEARAAKATDEGAKPTPQAESQPTEATKPKPQAKKNKQGKAASAAKKKKKKQQ